MPSFNSSAIKLGEYDPSSLRMTLWFPEGHSYTSCRVPSDVWDGLLNASSKGRYYAAYISGRYHC